jgi:hypothetical protein
MWRSAQNHLHLHSVSRSPINIADDYGAVECDALKMAREMGEKYTCNIEYNII